MRRLRSVLATIAFVLFLIFLVACAVPEANPTPTPTQTPAPTVELTALPTTVPISIIKPIPLPTTVPNQAALIKKATRTDPVDFVIDTQQLEHGVAPWWFFTRSIWYKYTSSDGAFTVLMHGGIAPKESTLNELLGPSYANAKVVKADYLGEENQAISYFEIPALASGQSNPAEVLKSADLAKLAGAAAKIEVVADHPIQLSGYPGRELLIQLTSQDLPTVKMALHIRLYVVGKMLYELIYAGFGKSAYDDTEDRFLNSFTLNISAQ